MQIHILMIIGIDLGTTHSLSAAWIDGHAQLIPNALGAFLTPSCVSMEADGSILVGQAARERLQSHPDRTAATFKRAMGTAKVFHLGPKIFRAEELSAFVLRALRLDAEAMLGEPVKQTVITVPAYFSDVQRQATRSAGLLAGFDRVSLLNEPTAAALAYGLHQKSPETQFLVFDFGGGTFDVSILEIFEDVMEVRATAGDNHLGGEDVDELLANAFAKSAGLTALMESDTLLRAQVRAVAEGAKLALATRDEVEVAIHVKGQLHQRTYALADMEALLEPLLLRLRLPVERALRDAHVRPEQLAAVVLAGGSTRLRSVRQLVTRMFGRFPETALNPDEIVALGAAVQAGLQAKDASLAERVMTDVCPYTLGINTSNEVSPGRQVTGFMAPVL
ncbi:Hsp70 protein [Xylophilus ampelinus]|uniref:Hsp70 protein n=1 Tax=Xylophilus ampelinus TaxID=54067 RepID=A0A318SPR4_9BURK|nr:Hsp70 protein [Xylophilus ampelinus]